MGRFIFEFIRRPATKSIRLPTYRGFNLTYGSSAIELVKATYANLKYRFLIGANSAPKVSVHKQLGCGLIGFGLEIDLGLDRPGTFFSLPLSIVSDFGRGLGNLIGILLALT